MNFSIKLVIPTPGINSKKVARPTLLANNVNMIPIDKQKIMAIIVKKVVILFHLNNTKRVYTAANSDTILREATY